MSSPSTTDLADFLIGVGNNFVRERQYASAEEAYNRAVAAHAHSPEALIKLGHLAIREGRYEQAEQHFALVRDNYSALVGLAMVNLRRHRYAEAACFAARAALMGQAEECLDYRPYFFLAAAHRGRGDHEAERSALDEGLALLPDAGELYHVRATLNLLHRRWAEGWQDNEHRSSRIRLRNRFDEIEEWDGSDCAAETLLIFGEGEADQHLLFSRYVPEVLNRRSGVVFCTRPELGRFFSDLNVSILTSEQEIDRVLASSSRCCWVGLGSLPHRLRMSEPIKPVRQRGSREDVERFATLIGNAGTLRVGIYWSDTSLERLFDLPGCSFYSLQRVRGGADKRVLDLASHCHDIADLAAAIKNLDLIITADSHVAHVAATVGKPTWVLSPRSWIWGCEEDDVQWYPTVRVFRANVIERVSAELGHAANQHQRTESNTPPPPLSALVKKQCRYGEMSFHRTDHWIGRSLDLYGEWSEGEVQLFRKIVTPGDVVIEAGANVGALTIPLAQIVGDTGRVHAFEPQRDNFACLEANVRRFSNITLWPKALASSPYRISYSKIDLEKVCNLGSTEISAHRGEDNSDFTTTIDELFSSAPVSFIKADVEGMELEILQGAVATIEQRRPILYVEDDREQNSHALRRWLVSRGYRLYRHTPPLYNPKNWRGSRVNVFGRTVSINLLCIPDSRYDLKSTTDLLQRVRA